MIKSFFVRYYDYLLLCLCILITVLLGSRMIFAKDFFFLADQGRDFLLVKDIVVNHKLALIGTHSGLGGFFHGPLWLYLLVPVFLLGYGNPLVFAYFYIFLAVITVAVGFFIGKKLYGKTFAVFVAFLLATSSVIWSNIPNTIGVNMMPLLFILLFFFIIRFLRGDIKSFIFAAFFTGLSFQFETASAIMLVPVVLLTFFLQKKAWTNWKVIIGSITAFFLSLITFIFFDIRHQFLTTKAIISFFHSNNTAVKGYLAFPERIFEHAKSLWGVYESIFYTDSLFVLLLCLLMLISGILMVKTGRIKKEFVKEFILLTFFPFVTYIFFLVYPFVVWPEYVLGLTIPVAFGFALLMQQISSKKVGLVLVVLFFVVTSLPILESLKQQYAIPFSPNQTAGSYQVQKSIVAWIIKDSKGSNFGYFVYTPETFTYGMDYLFWWLGKSSGYMPESKKLPTTYLVMYPPLAGDANAHEYWKTHVLHTTGTVMLRKVFPGNIIVEKLVIPVNDPQVDPNYYQNLIFR